MQMQFFGGYMVYQIGSCYQKSYFEWFFGLLDVVTELFQMNIHRGFSNSTLNHTLKCAWASKYQSEQLPDVVVLVLWKAIMEGLQPADISINMLLYNFRATHTNSMSPFSGLIKTSFLSMSTLSSGLSCKLRLSALIYPKKIRWPMYI